MTSESRTSERLRKLSDICLKLPEATRKDMGDHAAFLVGKKTFAYCLNDHHGDGIVSVCCKVLPHENNRLAAVNPKKFYIPAYIGPRGWVGLRLDHATVDWNEVAELVRGSYMQMAPKKFASLVKDEPIKKSSSS